EVSKFLQAVEVDVETIVERRAVPADRIEERVGRNGAVSRILDDGADEPHGPPVRTTGIQVSFFPARRAQRRRSPRAEAKLRGSPRHALYEMELVTRMDDGRSVQGRSVLGGCGREDLLTIRGRCDAGSPADGKFGVPEVGDDPHAQQVVAEVPERA